MSRQILPAQFEKLFVHVNHLDRRAPQQIVADLDGFLVVTAGIEKSNDFIKDVLCGDQRRQNASSQTAPVVSDCAMVLVVGQFQSQNVSRIQKD